MPSVFGNGKGGKKNVTSVLKKRLLDFFVKMHEAGKGNTARNVYLAS